MLSKLSKNIALFFSKRGVVDERFEEIYELGYKELMSEIMLNSILILVAYLCGLFIEGIIFMSVFSLFRHCCGGYHARTRFLCTILYLINYSTVLCIIKLCKYVEINVSILLVCAVVSGITLLSVCPLRNTKFVVAEEVLRKNKHKIMLYLAISIIGIIMLNIYSNPTLTSAALSIVLAIISTVVSAVAGTVQNRRRKETKKTIKFKFEYIKKIAGSACDLKNKAYWFRVANAICSCAAIAFIISTTRYCRGKYYQPDISENAMEFIESLED